LAVNESSDRDSSTAIPDLEGVPSAFTPDYAPEEMFEIAKKLWK
jgi:hypothetical protein